MRVSKIDQPLVPRALLWHVQTRLQGDKLDVVLFMWDEFHFHIFVSATLAVHVDLDGELMADSAQSLTNETRNVLR